MKNKIENDNFEEQSPSHKEFSKHDEGIYTRQFSVDNLSEYVEFIYYTDLKVGRNAAGVLELIVEEYERENEKEDLGLKIKKETELFVKNLVLLSEKLKSQEEYLIERMYLALSAELSTGNKSEIEEYTLLGYGIAPKTAFDYIDSITSFYRMIKHIKHLNRGIIKEFSLEGNLWVPTIDNKDDKFISKTYQGELKRRVLSTLEYLKEKKFFENPKKIIPNKGKGLYFPTTSQVLAVNVLEKYLVYNPKA